MAADVLEQLIDQYFPLINEGKLSELYDKLDGNSERAALFALIYDVMGDEMFKYLDGQIFTDMFQEVKAVALEIPEDIKVIRHYAFSHIPAKEIKLPKILMHMGDGLFYQSNSLCSVQLPENLTVLPGATFYECANLTTVELPKGLKIIQDFAFAGCTKLREVLLPDTLTSISTRAFANCPSLKELVIPKSVTAVYSNILSYYPDLTIYCEAESKPDGWVQNWAGAGCQVVWGYKRS